MVVSYKYYIINPIFNGTQEVSEDDFFAIVGFDRKRVPMTYEPGNVNRQNFYEGEQLLGYRVRQRGI